MSKAVTQAAPRQNRLQRLHHNSNNYNITMRMTQSTHRFPTIGVSDSYRGTYFAPDLEMLMCVSNM